MKRPHLTARQASKLKRTVVVATILIALALLVFAEVVRPNQEAKTYTSRLDTASKPLQSCFDDLAKTTELNIYYAPDTALITRQQDARTITNEINICRTELATFEAAAQQLSGQQLAGYTNTYRTAKVNQRQAIDVAGQSRDVLNQYARLADFLTAYYKHIEAFSSYMTATNESTFFDTARLQAMSAQADDMRVRADQIRALQSPPEFNDTKTTTAAMFTTAASGFDNLVGGYNFGNDSTVNLGYRQIDEAQTSYDSTVINLPFEQLTRSYIPQQVMQLPVKIENLLAGESE